MSKVCDDIKKDTAELDMTPMIDVVFLLIIFFMVVTELSKRENESVALPKATETIKDQKNKGERIVINITYVPPGDMNPRLVSNIRIQGQTYNELDELQAFLTSHAKRAGMDGIASKLKVKIRADGHCEYQKVQRVMVACMKSGISKVSFGAAPNPNN